MVRLFEMLGYSSVVLIALLAFGLFITILTIIKSRNADDMSSVLARLEVIKSFLIRYPEFICRQLGVEYNECDFDDAEYYAKSELYELLLDTREDILDTESTFSKLVNYTLDPNADDWLTKKIYNDALFANRLSGLVDMIATYTITTLREDFELDESVDARIGRLRYLADGKIPGAPKNTSGFGIFKLSDTLEPYPGLDDAAKWLFETVTSDIGEVLGINCSNVIRLKNPGE